jgi:DNA polymerase-1
MKMKAAKKPIILVDGSSYLYRAFHALPALTTSKGFPTGAVYGMISMLKRLLADYDPDYIAVIFDAKGKTFRDELYAAYKANRHAMPDDLSRQIEPIHRIIEALGIPLIMMEGIEADDVIGTLTVIANEHHLPSLISTGDKDFAQLVQDDITLINTMTNTLLNTESVKKKFGIPPALIVDYLTLVGDSSDNIPGVPLVGPKTAVKWLEQYGNLDNIIANADHIPGKVGEHLRASLSQLPLTKTLVTIKQDMNIAVSLVDLARKPPDPKSLIEHYKEMEFKGWLDEMLKANITSIDEKTEYAVIETEADLSLWIDKLNQSEVVAIHLEGDSSNYMSANLIGVSFAIGPGSGAYVPFGHDYENAPKQLSKTRVFAQLKPLIKNPAIKKVVHHSKYGIEILANLSIQDLTDTFDTDDTELESYVLDSTSSNHDLPMLALKYLGIRMMSLDELQDVPNKQFPFNQVELKKAGTYAAHFADITLRIHHILWERIEKMPGLKYIYEQIEMPLVPVLARMELNGVLVDAHQLEKQEEELKQRTNTLQQEIFEIAGETFNLNSPKQLQAVLFDGLKLPVLQKTPTGQPSTADQVLQELALDFAIARMIIEYRSLSKLMTTYTTRLVQEINPKTGRIHTTYHQTGAQTGRLSSSGPNLQNIPIRSKEGRRIRQAFIANKGFKLISADYSQIELRLMAHISEDPGLLKAFTEHSDIHQATAAEVWNVKMEEVTEEMRRNAKAINFGLIYGMSAFGLTRQLGIDQKAAVEYIERYFNRYPEVKTYMEKTKTFAKAHGFVETLWGRRLYLPDINASNFVRQNAALRAAINAPLQGSAADIIKLAMIRTDEFLTEKKINARMIMQVHDELVFEVDENVLPEFIEIIRKLMTEIVSLRVPLIVAIGVGNNWDEASAHA